MNWLPESVADMRKELGACRTLKEVQKAQERVSAWAVTVAEHKYPDLVNRPETELLELTYEAAVERWEGFQELADELIMAERGAYRNMRAMA